MDRRRTLEVRVVGAPHEAVDADLVTHLGLVAFISEPPSQTCFSK